MPDFRDCLSDDGVATATITRMAAGDVVCG